jgi:hypothetical protein
MAVLGGEGNHGDSIGDRATIVPALGTVREADSQLFSDDSWGEQGAAQRLRVLPWPELQAQPINIAGTLAGAARPWADASTSLFALAVAGSGEGAGRSPGFLAAARGASGPLSFDTSTGQLAIRPDGGEHTVRESLATDGFVDVTVDGQGHSSNPNSVSFDNALSGATAATVTGVR